MGKQRAARSKIVRQVVRVRTMSGLPYDHVSLQVSRLYHKHCTEKGMQAISFDVPAIPPSVNHIYKKFRKNFVLEPRVREFRDIVSLSMGYRKEEWKPKGVVAIVVVLYSPAWITQERKVRERDVDNNLKSLIDAIKEACNWPDENAWHEHIFKVASNTERTHVELFDLGDVVEYLLKE